MTTQVTTTEQTTVGQIKTSASDIVSKYVPTRTIVLTTAIWMTWLVSDWAMWFATGNSRNGVEIAAIVAAVTAPICAFGGYVFKTFADSNKSL
jgi:hypothetical protein